MGRKYDRKEILKQIDPVHRDEVERILAGEKTDGQIGQALRFNVDRYTMAAWDRGLLEAVKVLRKCAPAALNAIALVTLF
jgi:hypothetical protein